MVGEKMNFPDRQIVEKIKQEYPKGSRIVLDEMQDPYCKLPPGLQGTVLAVDDCGTIHCAWDNGSSLGVAYGEDRCHHVTLEAEIQVSLEHRSKRGKKLPRCPRCGREATPNNRLLALSRRAYILICEECGLQEALEDVGVIERMSLYSWAIVQAKWKL